MILPVLSKPVNRKRFMKLSNTASVKLSDNGDDENDTSDETYDEGGDDDSSTDGGDLEIG